MPVPMLPFWTSKSAGTDYEPAPSLRILRLAASAWRDEHEMTWLERAPHVTVLPETNRRPAYPLSWEEQVFF